MLYETAENWYDVPVRTAAPFQPAGRFGRRGTLYHVVKVPTMTTDETTEDANMTTARVRIESELWTAARLAAIKAGKPVQELMADALRAYLETHATQSASHMTTR